MKRIAIIVTLAIGCQLAADAQALFTERIQQRDSKAEGKLTITHSQAIDQLVNRGSQPVQANQATKPAVATTATAATTSTATTASKATARKPDSVKQTTIAPTPPHQRRADSERSDSSQKTAKADEPKRSTTAEPTTGGEESESTASTVDTRKKVMRRSYRVTGYRVQAYAGGNQRKDRQRAEQIGNDIKQNYPDEPIYVHFYSPRWICRVGNYRTYEEAHQMLLNIRRLGYNSATIVKGKISIQY